MARRGENIYHRKDLRWEGRYHAGRKANGQIKYGYVYGKTFEEVKEKLVPLREQAQITLAIYGKSVVTYEDFSTHWLAKRAETLKPATISSYASKLRHYLYPHLGKLSLYQINEALICQVIEVWKKTGLNMSSIKLVLRLLNQTLNTAVKQGILSTNPCENIQIQLPADRKKRVTSLTRKEQKKLRKTAMADSDERAKAVILAMETGMRIGEIAGLKWGAVDFDQRLIYVNHTYQRVTTLDGLKTVLHLGAPKTQASLREIPMSNRVHNLLKGLKQKAKSAFVFSTKGKACEPRLLTYHFHRVRAKAGMKGVHFHQLRHTFATRCLETTSQSLDVSQLLGHSSTKLTTDVYGHSMLNRRVSLIAAMEKAG
ncbi:tyrosine-type recombinase/integrase [Enterococcus sp. AZ109]|uniref:tyrosine-type recombinase/integrase n=1 Tax=Enterococcus sp. AZ109 TaxID=2774634 RepID=UPI003F2524CB